MTALADNSVQLIVTSPPYPMIEMWDKPFAALNSKIAGALESRPAEAFELMHQILDEIWREAFRVLSPGGFCCINVGDATRSVNGNFRLYSNHSRIISRCCEIGFENLPPVIWRKPTNAPNKFMGSGMLPAGAYVTYEHEYILVLRKGGKRDFSGEEQKKIRNASAYFWEERNIWFSDLWQLNGTRQNIAKASRLRSAAFPLELPYRLIHMYSVYGDTVLDPFSGTGTTATAALVSGRNSLSYELDKTMVSDLLTIPRDELIQAANSLISERLKRHLLFVEERQAAGKEIKHKHELYGFPVMTNQERQSRFYQVSAITATGSEVEAMYREIDIRFAQSPNLKATA